MKKLREDRFYIVKRTYAFGILRGDRITNSKVVSRGFAKYDDATIEKIGLEAKEEAIKLRKL